MTKRLLAIYLILVVLLAAFVPSCTQQGGGTGTINVQATLCGNPWTGNVSYTLTGPSTVNGNNVSASFNNATGTWTCAYVSGGPAGAFLKDITPSASQTLSADGTITFTLNFELNQDAWITLIPQTWTVNGDPIGEPNEPVYEGAVPCNVIDAHFQQGVDGCAGYNVTMNETSWLSITQTLGPPATIYVVNDNCAVNKTANAVKVSQVPSVNNATAVNGTALNLTIGMTTTLDVETQWQLVKDITYVKSINWFGISLAPFELPGSHPCVLFELVLPGPGNYHFTLKTSAQVYLVGSTDVNPTNDNSGWSPALTLMVNVGP
jgi:hypothetical protein